MNIHPLLFIVKKIYYVFYKYVKIIAMEETNIEWQAFEYPYQTKTADWFWVVWIIAVGIAVTAYLFNNILFGVFVLLGAFSLSLFGSRQPDLLIFRLSPKGITIKNKLIPFFSLKSFWVEDGKIIFQAKNKIIPFIVVPLNDEIDNEQLREYLLEHLEEEEHHEPILQRIAERLGF